MFQTQLFVVYGSLPLSYLLFITSLKLAFIFHAWCILLGRRTSLKTGELIVATFNQIIWKTNFSFNIWSMLFPFVRVVTIGLALVVYFLEIPRVLDQSDSTAPHYSTCFFTRWDLHYFILHLTSTLFRLLSFSSLCALQAWLFLSYINLQRRLKKEEEAIKKANAAAKNAKLQSKKLAAGEASDLDLKSLISFFIYS